ncbi:MAG: AAA family ATPase [Zoogloeaceae bacterium]|jgi:5-methylcytosine-specific restriction protein B|nr:AAA family ATPase [Zoogloeaceae bacterium]
MSTQTGSTSAQANWFVSAGDRDHDQTQRFLSEGIWESSNPDDASRDLVRSMRPGERIAIKSHPYEGRKQPSVMDIKAVGTITENLNDGKRVKVKWAGIEPARKWYFFTYIGKIWRVLPGNWMREALIAFTFDNKPQDMDRFRNDPFWQGRYGIPVSGTRPLDFIEGSENSTDVPYSVEEILKNGCVLKREKLSEILTRLHDKKNLILQGPPGTGKTWLAKRLARALIGTRDDKRICAVQFHPNLSYEDFVRGWRPGKDGKLALADGVFMEAVGEARKDADTPFVVVIEEINRGQPAQIFGELLTLLEADKRNAASALTLVYPDPGTDEKTPVWLPKNLHVIGTMNVADRSLALVDLALRRRFAFVDLGPELNGAWLQWVTDHGIPPDTAKDIQQRITTLNDKIEKDDQLGRHFLVGHSYVTPTERVQDAREWFRQIVATEIRPLLDEYWFDNPEKVEEASTALLADG